MRILSFVVCFFLMISPVLAKDFKVATVDLAKLFADYPGTKAAQDKFNAIAQKKQKDLAGQEQDLQDLDAELKKQSSVLTPKQKSDKEYILKKKLEDYSQQKNQILAELKTDENQMTDDILTQIKAIVTKVAQGKGVDVVLDSEKTILVTNPVDLTDEVEKAFPAASDSDSSK
ncbi:MAG TPA: OmpH family outer membrane protein [bacterium]|nr:OmpH family outer membrane protein [bacterium]